MASVSFTIRMDEELKNDFERICRSFGISTTEAINLFSTAVVNERRIPFEMMSKSWTKEEAIMLFEKTREEALSRNPNGMTLDEINAEIVAARKLRD